MVRVLTDAIVGAYKSSMQDLAEFWDALMPLSLVMLTYTMRHVHHIYIGLARTVHVHRI